MEDSPPYPTGPAETPNRPSPPRPWWPPLTPTARGFPTRPGEQLLQRLPERLRTLADYVLSGKANAGDVAYAVAALIDMIESAPAAAGPRRH